MIRKLVKAKTEKRCYFCLSIIRRGDNYYKVSSPSQRSIGIEALCKSCYSPEETILRREVCSDPANRKTAGDESKRR